MPATLAAAPALTKGQPRSTASFYREADNATYGYGELVTLSSGRVTDLCAKNAASTSGGNKVLGIALRAARNTTNPGQITWGATTYNPEDVPVMLLDDQTQFLLPYYDATASNTQYGNITLGTSCQLFRNAAGFYTAAVAATSTPVVQLVDKMPFIPATETYYWAWFKVLPSMRFIA